MRLALAALLLVACDAQVDSAYPGEPLARVRGTATGFRDGLATTGVVRWSSRGGGVVDDGPRQDLPLYSAPPARLSLLVVDRPPGDAFFGFDGESVRIAEGGLFLADDGQLVGVAIDHVLVYVDGVVEPGSVTADYLGGALAPGYHLLETRATAGLSSAQAILVERCGGGEACRWSHLYRLLAALDGWDTELLFVAGSDL